MTPLASFFSPYELARALKIDRARAEALTRVPEATVTMTELGKLLDILRIKKKPLPEPLQRGRKPKLPPRDESIPESIDTLRFVIESRGNRNVRLKYKSRTQVFEALDQIRTPKLILKEIFDVSDCSNEELGLLDRKNRFWSNHPLDAIRRVSPGFLKKLQQLFSEEFWKFRNLARRQEKFQTLYGFTPKREFDYAAEAVVDNAEKENPADVMSTTIDLDYGFVLFRGTDLEFIKKIKEIDWHYYQVKGPREVRFYTHTGSFIGVTDHKTSYYVTYRGVLPLERRVIPLPSTTAIYGFPLFADVYVTAFRDEKSTIVLTKEGSARTRLEPSYIESQLKETDYYNIRSEHARGNLPDTFTDEGHIRTLPSAMKRASE